VIQTTLPDASVKHARYDHRGQVTARWGALDYPTSYGYNELGAMTSLTTCRANTTGAEPLPEDVGDTTVCNKGNVLVGVNGYVNGDSFKARKCNFFTN